MSKTALKYTSYSIISLILISLPFLLTQIEFFLQDLNGLALLFIIFPITVFLHGIASALMLRGKARLVYVFCVPVYSAVALPTLLFLLSSAAVPSFDNYLKDFAVFFTYPVFIFTIGVIITGWLGMIAVCIFKKLNEKSKARLEKIK